MYYPGAHAQSRPDHPAVVIADTGESIDYRTLNDRSNRIAQLLHARGFRPGDRVAILMENNIR